MRKTVVVLLLIVPPGVFAQELPIDCSLSCDVRQLTAHVPPEGLVQVASLWQVKEVEGTLATAALQQQQQQQPTRSWAGRHPVLLGALIGAGAGAAMGAAMCSPESNCDTTRGQWAAFQGAVGAGVGALAGLIVSIARR